MEEIKKEDFEREMEKMLEANDMELIGLDDTFSFKCRGCGKCCRNRHDILLTPMDVFKMAKYLETDIEGFLDLYCNVCLDRSGFILVVVLKAIGGNERCPFLVDKKCRVHEVKPSVCAMYPIGRMYNAGIPKSELDFSSPASVEYIHVKVECNHKHKNQTVREWLENVEIPIDDTYYFIWNGVVNKLARYMHMARERNATAKTQKITLEAFFQLAFIEYDSSKDFRPQFEQNIEKVDEMLDMFIAAAEILLPEKEDDVNNG